ncbi:MAG: hypothetical protein ACRD2D_09900, partial [Terriglobales bacterium]
KIPCGPAIIIALRPTAYAQARRASLLGAGDPWRPSVRRRLSGAEDVTAVCVITPAAIGPEYFREAAALIAAAGGGEPARAAMIEVMRRHRLTPAPPPGKDVH